MRQGDYVYNKQDSEGPSKNGQRPRVSDPGCPLRIGPVQTPGLSPRAQRRALGSRTACHSARSLSSCCPRCVWSSQGCGTHGPRSGCLEPSAVSRSWPAPGRATASGRRGRTYRDERRGERSRVRLIDCRLGPVRSGLDPVPSPPSAELFPGRLFPPSSSYRCPHPEQRALSGPRWTGSSLVELVPAARRSWCPRLTRPRVAWPLHMPRLCTCSR